MLRAYHSQHKKDTLKKNKEKKDTGLDKGTWGKEHDRKLLELKVSTTDLGKKYIESVLKKNFPGRS